MHVTHRLIALTAVCGLCLGAEAARAQEAEIDVDMEAPPPPAATPYDNEGVVVVRQEAPEARVEVADIDVEEDIYADGRPRRGGDSRDEADIDVEEDIYADSIFFLEASAATGVQLGDTEYLPSGTPGDWQFPLVYGFGVGGTAGVMVGDQIALVGTYMYQRAQTRDGQLDGAITNVEGRIDYHTALGGVRLYVPTGFGAFRGEVAVGVVFPHETVLQVDYGPGLALLPQPITGSGFRTSNFSVGFGGQARIGYEIPIAGPVYAALDVQLQVFQAENSGETTELENFVVDFEAPTPVNATILHGDGAERPETRGVSSGLGVLSVGVRL